MKKRGRLKIYGCSDETKIHTQNRNTNLKLKVIFKNYGYSDDLYNLHKKIKTR